MKMPNNDKVKHETMPNFGGFYRARTNIEKLDGTHFVIETDARTDGTYAVKIKSVAPCGAETIIKEEEF